MAEHAFHNRCSPLFSIGSIFLLLALGIGTAISLFAVGTLFVFLLGLPGDIFDSFSDVTGPSNLVILGRLKEITIG